MNEFDGRKIDRKALEEIRIRAVKRVEAGESPEVVIKALGLTRPRIHEWNPSSVKEVLKGCGVTSQADAPLNFPAQLCRKYTAWLSVTTHGN